MRRFGYAGSRTALNQTGWNIEKSSSAVPGFISLISIASPSLRTYEDSASIDANSTYWYRVQPYNGYGTGSFSNEASASFGNVLYFSGSSKYYVNPTGYINESGSAWKGCFGYKNTGLTHLDVSYNSLTTLNLISASALTRLTCSNNNLTSLDVRSAPSLFYLDCTHNSLTYLRVNSGSSLFYLYCHYNQLTSLDVTFNEVNWLLEQSK
jgi:Leucine-rich repeat (LRR) protein